MNFHDFFFHKTGPGSERGGGVAQSTCVHLASLLVHIVRVKPSIWPSAGQSTAGTDSGTFYQSTCKCFLGREFDGRRFWPGGGSLQVDSTCTVVSIFQLERQSV